MTDPIVRIRDLVKCYASGLEALRGVDLDIREGEILALLGPNGAGKTTGVKMLTTLERPDAGTATIAGLDVVADAWSGSAKEKLEAAGGSIAAR